MQKVIIMRGLPGSGKSTQAKEILRTLQEDAVICSADHYFIDSNTGEYKWEGDKLNLAHKHCWNIAKQALENNTDVIIDNTNIRRRDVKRWVTLANEFSAMVEIHEADTDWALDTKACFEKCTHDVPLETIERFASIYQTYECEFVQDEDTSDWINILQEQ